MGSSTAKVNAARLGAGGGSPAPTGRASGGGGERKLTFTTVGADTVVVNINTNGTRFGTSALVTGREPSIVIDPDAPTTWPAWSVTSNNNGTD